jgi:hypothetical protein
MRQGLRRRLSRQEVIVMINMSAIVSRSRVLLASFALVGVAALAEAGPPLICHRFDAGNATLLPWASSTAATNWNAPDPSYDITKLTADTLRLLSPDAPILARMENMRRATIYAGRDERVAAELLAAVMARAQGDAGKGRDALAWFDAGYLVESYRQASHIYKWDMLEGRAKAEWKMRSEPAGVDGYALVRKALHVGGSNPEMEYAASLMKAGTVSDEHRRRAVAGAPAGSLLARNLANH